MDFAKRNKFLLDKTLRKTSMDTSNPYKGHIKFQEMESLASPTGSETIPLNFIFVPSFGTLPSEVLLEKQSNYLPKIVGDKRALMQKPEDIHEKFIEKTMHESPQTIYNTVHKPTSQETSLQKEFASNEPENINHHDLFIAEFVVVMDSDDDEIIAKNSETLPFKETKYEFRETLQQATMEQPKVTPIERKANEMYVTESQEDGRSVSDRESQQICSAGLDSNSLELSNVSYPDRKILICSEEVISSEPVTVDKLKSAVDDTIHTPSESIHSNSLHTLTRESPLCLYTKRCLYSPTDLEILEYKTTHTNQSGRSNVLSPLPIHVTKYPLCRSPSPLSYSFFGSSSTICSMNESTCSIPKPDATSPASSRLSFLTSLLKSKRSSSKRTISPDYHYRSEPMTTSPTPSAIKKLSVIPDPPRKAQSCFSLNYPKESKTIHFQRKAEILPSASEANILYGEFPFHQSPNRTLSPDSIHVKPSDSPLAQKRSKSPSFQLHHRSITSPTTSREHILSFSEKPPISRLPYSPIKKYSVLGKSKRVTLFPFPFHFDQSLHHLPDEKKSEIKSHPSPRDHFRSTSLASSEISFPYHVMSNSSMDIGKKHSLLQTQSALICSENMDIDPDTCQPLNQSSLAQTVSSEVSEKNSPLCPLSTNISAQSRSVLSRSCELPSRTSLSPVSDLENKKLYKIKSSYKSFAAIPTNTLLLDQKAIDEKNARTNEDEDKQDTHAEMCSPALLRQQTEEICAAIDEVLHDPFPMHSNSTSRSPNLKSGRKSVHIPKPPIKSAGRETRYASLQPLINTKAKDPQTTRPGVIRPMSAIDNKDRKFYPNLFQHFSMPPYKRE
ncbi:muscular LMNA-interacting protein isoform 1-T2 [Anomaloglossus baeobatrachus]|uniref:muscular LMNA-interacting protein n=1 Tax=Anomaloglossus baeobatrachus TaxID=238106 RepID=UPI003F5097D1